MRRHNTGAGFSLVELLVVLVIIAIVSAFAIPAIMGALQSSSLTSAGDEVSAMLSLARQHAMARNRQVEVRWYQFADPSFPGEVAGSPATGHFRAVQAFEINESGTAVEFTKMQRLPAGIIMDAGTTLSSLFGSTFATSSPQTTSIPLAGTLYNYCAFRFLNDGSTNITTIGAGSAVGPPWFITLHSLNYGDNLAAPPKNYATMDIDPTNGSATIFRP